MRTFDAATFKVPEWANKFECLVSVPVALVECTRSTSTRRGQDTTQRKDRTVSIRRAEEVCSILIIKAMDIDEREAASLFNGPA